MSSWLFWLLRLSRRIWVRAGLISLLAILAAAVSPVIGPLLPDEFTQSIDADNTRRLLDILSTTMLTITTFSLTVITAAHLTAAQSVTPRVHRLLREDGRTQTVLATFMGAFVYSLVTIVLMNLRLHGKEDFGTVYIFTVGVIGLVTVAILRWIQHLTTVGAMDASIGMLAGRTRQSVDRWRQRPNLGGLPAISQPPAGSVPLTAAGFGYLQTIDVARLDKLARQNGGQMHLAARPGDFLSRGAPLAWLTGGFALADPGSLRESFVLGEQRTWELDPAYGLIVLSEIASRALSPGINDPRTAEAVTVRLHELLALAAEPGSDEEPEYGWLSVPILEPDTLFRLAADPIARDGSSFVEVQTGLQSMFADLATRGNEAFRQAARNAAARALLHARKGLPLEEDLARVRDAAP